MSPAGGGTAARRTCTATTGFFVLARCERGAQAACSRCQRSICRQHWMQLPGDPAGVCPECYAAARGYIEDPDDPLWSVGYRRNFYWDLSSGTGDQSWWTSFDAYDREAFDITAAEGELAGDEGWGDGGADFLDS